jgi:hypothetical protein
MQQQTGQAAHALSVAWLPLNEVQGHRPLRVLVVQEAGWVIHWLHKVWPAADRALCPARQTSDISVAVQVCAAITITTGGTKAAGKHLGAETKAHLYGAAQSEHMRWAHGDTRGIFTTAAQTWQLQPSRRAASMEASGCVVGTHGGNSASTVRQMYMCQQVYIRYSRNELYCTAIISINAEAISCPEDPYLSQGQGALTEAQESP